MLFLSFRAAVGVALRKESVDRNEIVEIDKILNLPSLSARRAWIEIPRTLHVFPAPKVALRKESVDRNLFVGRNRKLILSRSPQGERG